VSRPWRSGRAIAFVATFAVAAVLVAPGRAPATQATAEPDPVRVAEARQLFLIGCASCHGEDGSGTSQGPSLERSGEAGAYYYLSTGRMPMADNREQPRRKAPVYSPEEMDLLVEYVASLGRGPALPEVDLSHADLAEGGVLFRSHCAPCHTAAGIGGALSYGRAAPSVHASEPEQVAAAVRAGPGQMPVFGPEILNEEQLNDVVAYVQYLRSPATPGGAALGGSGPISEGFVSWIFGVGALMLAVLWIGKRQTGKRQEGHGGA
jgi:ubiquinol-cytochrome c reductase cytochrome c subunit